MVSFDLLLNIGLVLLCLVALWMCFEIAVTVKAARKSIYTVTQDITEAMDEIKPIISKVDGMVDDLSAATKQLEPLSDEARVTIQALNADLTKMNGILDDVSSVTGVASGVTSTVTKVADSAAQAAAGLIDKVSGKATAALEEPSAPQILPEADSKDNAEVSDDTDYFTYPVDN